MDTQTQHASGYFNSLELTNPDLTSSDPFALDELPNFNDGHYYCDVVDASTFLDRLDTDQQQFDQASLVDPQAQAVDFGDLVVPDIQFDLAQLTFMPLSGDSLVQPAGTKPTNSTRGKPSGAAKRILERCFGLEVYPSKHEVANIASRTSMSMKQVRQWFSNKRKRTTPADMRDLQAKASLASLPLTERSLEEHTRRSIEFQACTVTAPYQRSNAESVHSVAQEKVKAFDVDVHSLAKSDQRSIADSFRSTHYSASSRGSSAHSRFSSSSRVSKRSTASRKGRRRWDAALSGGVGDYPCTFCGKCFKTKYSCQRHEESVHLKQSTWTCRAHDPEYDQFGDALCPYCDQRIHEPLALVTRLGEHKLHHVPLRDCDYCMDPGLAIRTKGLIDHVGENLTKHLHVHKHGVCAERPADQRTFYRKEHAIQHLKSLHGLQREDISETKLHNLMLIESSDIYMGKTSPSASNAATPMALNDTVWSGPERISENSQTPPSAGVSLMTLVEDEAQSSLTCSICSIELPDWNACRRHLVDHLLANDESQSNANLQEIVKQAFQERA